MEVTVISSVAPARAAPTGDDTGPEALIVPTLLVGVVVVALSTAGFAVTMFGRKPLPQPAMATRRSGHDAVIADRVPADARAGGRARRVTTGAGRSDAAAVTGWRARLPLAKDRDPRPTLQVDVPTAVRIRSAFLLGLGVIAMAALVGVVLSVVVVGFFTLLG